MFYEVEIINGEACIIRLTNDGLTYIDNNHGRMPEFPLEFDGLPVTRIEKVAFSNKKIVKLPKSWGNITELGRLAFSRNEISELPEDWGIVSKIGDYCFSNNNIETISNWGIIQEIGEYAFERNMIEKIDNWGDLRVIKEGTFSRNNLSEFTASFRNIRWIKDFAFAENNIHNEIGDMYMVPRVEFNVFDANPDDETLFAKYRREKMRYRQAAGN